MAKEKDTRSLDLCAVGLGQGGGNLAAEWRRRGYRSLLFNTAQSDLSAVGHQEGLDMPESERIHIGIGETDGAGRDPEYGAKCVEAHADIIRRNIERHLDGADALLVCAGLGGGTGSSVYALLDALEPMEIPVVSVVTLPSHAESGITKVNAVRTANALVTAPLHGRLFIDNARLIDAFPDVDVVSYYPQVNAAVLGPLDLLNRLNRRSDVWSIRSFDAEDLRKVLLSGGVLQTHIETFEQGLTSPEQLADAAARCVDGGHHLASGLDLAQCAYLALVVTGPEEKLKKTSIKVFDEGAELLKARTGGGAVYEGLYVDHDEDAPVRAYILSASLALPQRVESLLADARTEGHDLMRKIQEDIPELEISPLEGLDLFRAPGRRQAQKERPDAPAPRALGAQMDAMKLPSAKPSIAPPTPALTPPNKVPAVPAPKATVPAKAAIAPPSKEPTVPPAQKSTPAVAATPAAAASRSVDSEEEAALDKIGPSRDEASDEISDAIPSGFALSDDEEAMVAAALQEVDDKSDIGATKMDLSEAPAAQKTAAAASASSDAHKRPPTGNAKRKPSTGRATAGKRERDLRRPPSAEAKPSPRAGAHEPTGVFRDPDADSGDKSAMAGDLEDVAPTEHIDAPQYDPRRRRDEMPLDDAVGVEPTENIEPTEMVAPPENPVRGAARRQVPLMTQDGLSEVESLNLPRDVSIPDGAALSDVQLDSFDPSLSEVRGAVSESDDLGVAGPTERLKAGDRERAEADARATDRHVLDESDRSSVRVGTGRVDADPYEEEPEVTEAVPKEQLRARAAQLSSSDEVAERVPSEFDVVGEADNFELPSSLTRPVDDDAIVAVEAFDDEEEETNQSVPPDSFLAQPTILSSVNLDDLLISSIQQTVPSHRGRGTALQNVYEDLIGRFKQAPDRRGRERVGRRLIDDAISDDVEVRALAVWAMSKLEQRGFKRALSKSANDKNPEIAKLANAGLEAIEVKQALKKDRARRRAEKKS